MFLFNLYLPPHYLTQSTCSQTCATCHLGETQVYTPTLLPTTRTTTGKHKYILYHYIISFIAANNNLIQIQYSITKYLH